jgi:hypothetical protein
MLLHLPLHKQLLRCINWRKRVMLCFQRRHFGTDIKQLGDKIFNRFGAFKQIMRGVLQQKMLMDFLQALTAIQILKLQTE